MGAAIMIALLANLKHLGEVLDAKNTSERNAFLASVIGFSGLVTSILCFICDRLFFMNRNVTIYVYLMSSAFPVGFLLISTILHYLTAKLWPVSSSLSTANTKAEKA